MYEKLIDHVKQGREDIFYNSWTWRKKRLEILEEQNKECQLCKEEGLVTVGTRENPLTVHHIKELKDYPELMLDDSNLLVVCSYHHNVIHDRFDGKESKVDKIGIPERWE